MKLPAPLPILAGGAAALGWLVGHQAAANDAAAAAPQPGVDTSPATDATSQDWGSATLDFGDSGTGAGTLNGIAPGATPAPGDLGMGGDGNYYTPPGYLGPPPSDGGGGTTSGGGGTPTPPPPTPGPPPPTTYTVARPATPAPPDAIGWALLPIGRTYRQALAGWNGKYPVRVGNQLTYGFWATRWISNTRTAILPTGASTTLRRVSYRLSEATAWSNDFISPTVTIYPASQASAVVSSLG